MATDPVTANINLQTRKSPTASIDPQAEIAILERQIRWGEQVLDYKRKRLAELKRRYGEP